MLAPRKAETVNRWKRFYSFCGRRWSWRFDLPPPWWATWPPSPPPSPRSFWSCLKMCPSGFLYKNQYPQADFANFPNCLGNARKSMESIFSFFLLVVPNSDLNFISNHCQLNSIQIMFKTVFRLKFLWLKKCDENEKTRKNNSLYLSDHIRIHFPLRARSGQF